MKQAIFGSIHLENDEKDLRYWATFSFEDLNHTMWFKFSRKYKENLVDNYDPFLLAIFFWAMENTDEVIIPGTLSQGLAANLDELMVIWNCWKPEKYTPFRIVFEGEEQPVQKDKNSAILAFSGGLDACSTLYRHKKGLLAQRSKDIRAAIMVHGFDIPRDMVHAFKAAAENSSKILSSFNVPLIKVETNIRDYTTNWEDSFFTSLFSVLTLFSKNFSFGLVANCQMYNSISLPWGSNPVSNFYSGSESFRVYTDGSELTRLDKSRLIADSKIIMENLRVCWQKNPRAGNCCSCEKCLRTMLGFKANNFSIPGAFKNDFQDYKIREIKINNPVQERYMLDILDVARKNHLHNETWYKLLSDRLKKRDKKSLSIGSRIKKKIKQLVKV